MGGLVFLHHRYHNGYIRERVGGTAVNAGILPPLSGAGRFLIRRKLLFAVENINQRRPQEYPAGNADRRYRQPVRIQQRKYNDFVERCYSGNVRDQGLPYIIQQLHNGRLGGNVVVYNSDY